MNEFDLGEYRDRIQREEIEARHAHARRDRDKDGRLKHIVCEGARFHVLSYGLWNDGIGSRATVTCSEPDCEINFE